MGKHLMRVLVGTWKIMFVILFQLDYEQHSMIVPMMMMMMMMVMMMMMR